MASTVEAYGTYGTDISSVTAIASSHDRVKSVLPAGLLSAVNGDGHTWLKYGEKHVANHVIRSYYKCVWSKSPEACPARKTVNVDPTRRSKHPNPSATAFSGSCRDTSAARHDLAEAAATLPADAASSESACHEPVAVVTVYRNSHNHQKRGPPPRGLKRRRPRTEKAVEESSERVMKSSRPLQAPNSRAWKLANTVTDTCVVNFELGATDGGDDATHVFPHAPPHSPPPAPHGKSEEQASGHQVQAQEPQLQCRTSYSAVSGDVEEFPEWLMEAVCGIDSSGADDASWLSNTLANLDRSAFCLEDVWDLPNHQDEVDHPQDQQGPWNKVEQAASPPHAPRNGADAPPPRDTALGHAASSSSSSAALSPPQDSKTEGEIVTEALQMSSHLSAGSSTQRDGKMGDVVGLGGKCGRAGALVDQERISCETAMAVSGRQCGLDRGNKMERVGAETLQAGTQQHHHLQRVYHPVFDVLGGGNSLSVWDFISCRD
ncbi:unnamed protein product [Closterium sp. NIES-54]